MNEITERLYLHFINQPGLAGEVMELCLLTDGTQLFDLIREECPESIAYTMSDADWEAVDIHAFKQAAREGWRKV